MKKRGRPKKKESEKRKNFGCTLPAELIQKIRKRSIEDDLSISKLMEDVLWLYFIRT